MAKPRKYCLSALEAFTSHITGWIAFLIFEMPRMDERNQVNLQAIGQSFGMVSPDPRIAAVSRDRDWYAVFTVPQNEKSVVKHLGMREVESFLPTYESVRVWKNRQRMKIVLPLFPTYVFARINYRERAKVLQSPGVLRIVGNSRECVPLPDSEVELLRHGYCGQPVEPYNDLVIGEKVRIKCGVMQGVQGTLVRKSGSARFVLTVQLINQHAAIQVDAEDLEPILN